MQVIAWNKSGKIKKYDSTLHFGPLCTFVLIQDFFSNQDLVTNTTKDQYVILNMDNF